MSESVSAQPSKDLVLDYIAPRWRRFLAAFIDGFILLIVASDLNTMILDTARRSHWQLFGELYDLMMLLLVLLLFSVYFIYEFCSHITLGSTPGKKLFGLAVVTAHGNQLSKTHLLKRSMAELMVTTVALCTLAYFCWVFFFVYEGGQNPFSTGYFEKRFYFNRQKMIVEIIAASVLAAWLFGNLVLLLFGRHRRSLHDRIAGTFVINERKRRKLQRS
ncbi:hypothetical protein BGP77_02505 [Saccharospirillum sp. MSK14-1]|uniref:RDD family protein n=1 Tax=Saccharospirillum sp. MSK14-1 TaxID=1897632 RepID=UPI000D38D14F|nr:RDD family protein [Saccharospirillum sp. MSK14-1]PTY36202.1 hypothetical protein BGP77_02505 [Saccharospirillum sp. MSK14-1]